MYESNKRRFGEQLELLRGNIQDRLADLRAKRQPTVLTIGNFDGVHLGHQAILKQVTMRAEAEQWSSQILLFEPQPREFFTKSAVNEAAPYRLMAWRDKYRVLSTFGLARLILMKFNQGFSALTPEAFVDRVLVQALDVRHLIVGEDFRFGSGRSGDLSFLMEQGKQKGFGVEKAATYLVDSAQAKSTAPRLQSVSQTAAPRRVSSTWVRTALKQGDLALATQLIGRPYELSGQVIRGQQLGRTWGFPTANIKLAVDPTALSGVFSVSAYELNHGPQKRPRLKEHFGVANLGRRPTLGGVTLSLEVHLFDFDGDLYGKRLGVRFHQKIRDEKKFEHKDALIEAIRADHLQAKKYWHDRQKN